MPPKIKIKIGSNKVILAFRNVSVQCILGYMQVEEYTIEGGQKDVLHQECKH